MCTALHEHVLGRPEFTGPTRDGQLGVTTRWLEDRVLPELTDSAACAAAPGAQAAEEVSLRTRSTYIIEVNGRRLQLTLPDGILGGRGPRVTPSRHVRRMQPLRGRAAARPGGRSGAAEAAPGENGAIAAPMQAIVTRICVEKGQRVGEGDLLIVLESMKMENYVHAPYDGTVADIPVVAGRTVSAGEVLVRMADDTHTQEA